MNFKKICSHPLLGSGSLRFLGLLLKHGFQLNLPNLFKIIYILLSTIVFSTIAVVESIFLSKQNLPQHLEEDPIFIIGHWRSGTTFLHYLLSRDEQFAYLNNSQAFMPGNMLLAQNLVQWLIRIHLFPKRPMDDISMSAQCAQEEEIALSNLGQGAYLGWYFPKQLDHYFSKYMLFENCGEEEKNRFKALYKKLIIKTSFSNGNKPLILKNPANTTRIEPLLEIFPNAKFIYLHRNPYEVYYSTVKLHSRMTERFAFQKVRKEEIEKTVMGLYPKVIEHYQKTKHLILEGQLMELDYNILTKRPIQALKAVYRYFNMTGFEKAKPEFDKFLKSQAEYKASTYNFKPERLRLIDLFWKANTTKYKATPMSID